MSRSEPLHAMFAEYWEWLVAEHPEGATSVGWHEHHDRWTDRSFDAIARRKERYATMLTEAQAFPRAELDEDDGLLLDLYTYDLQLEVDAARFPGELLAVNQVTGVQQQPANTLSMMPLTKEREVADFFSRLHGLPALIDQVVDLLREGVRTGVMQPAIVLRDVPEQVANIGVRGESSPLLVRLHELDPTVGADERARLLAEGVRVVDAEIAPAYERLHRFLVDEYLPAAREDIAATNLPDGRDWYAYSVRRMTTTELTPTEIHEIGISEVGRIRKEMDDVIASAGFDGTFEDWTQFLRTDPQFFHTSPDALLAEYRDIAKRADPELARLFGTLPRNPYGVCAIPAFAEKSQTTAYYRRGSGRAGRPGWFFANTYDLASRPRWEMEALTLHEAMPGHHLQISIAQEMEDVPDFRRNPAYTGYVEGWGLYSESLGTEMGFYKDPYSRFGQLTYEMWRAVRLVVDTGMHALGWTREQAIEFFASNTSKAHHDIVVEIDRYIAWPGQALAYKLGELKFKELRAHATATLGDRFDIRSFHDEVLRHGALPLDLLDRRTRAWVATEAASA